MSVPKEALEAVERLLRTRTGVTRGVVPVGRAMVTKIIQSGAAQSLIGAPRATRIWGCVATLLDNQEFKMVDDIRRTHTWMSLAELETKKETAVASWSTDQHLKTKAQASQLTDSVREWLTENEEVVAGTNVRKVRPGKLNQLKGARKNMAAKRGGPTAILAAILRLQAQGEAVMMQAPGGPRNKAESEDWITSTIQWMVAAGWEAHSQATTLAAKARDTCRNNGIGQVPQTLLVLDLGEGWGSIRQGIEQARPGARVVGADRRGQTYTGWRHGTITAELEHNWEGQHTDLLTALSKKASVPVGKWHLVTLCPECTLFSAVNAINQVKGAAHGKKAVTALNTTAASPARVALEMQWYNAAKKALETQLLSLEAHPHITFMLEGS